MPRGLTVNAAATRGVATGRWGDVVADDDTDDEKRLGLIDAALELCGVIGERAEEEDWEAITNEERLEIVTAMEKLVEVANGGLDHLKASHDSRTREEEVKQRREEMRVMTRRISA